MIKQGYYYASSFYRLARRQRFLFHFEYSRIHWFLLYFVLFKSTIFSITLKFADIFDYNTTHFFVFHMKQILEVLD